MLTEYFLEDCIQMTQFVPPPSDKKRKDKDEEGGEEEVRVKNVLKCFSASQGKPLCFIFFVFCHFGQMRT